MNKLENQLVDLSADAWLIMIDALECLRGEVDINPDDYLKQMEEWRDQLFALLPPMSFGEKL